jgi:hypothetical protein
MSASYRDAAGRIFSGNDWGSVQELQQDYSGAFKSIKAPIFKRRNSYAASGKAASVGDESPSANAESTTPMDDSTSSMEEFLPTTPSMMQVGATTATNTTDNTDFPRVRSSRLSRAETSEYLPSPLPSTIDEFQSSRVLFQAIPEEVTHHSIKEDTFVPLHSFERSFQSIQSKRSCDGASTGGSSRLNGRDGASTGGSSRVTGRDRRAARPRLDKSSGESVVKSVIGRYVFLVSKKSSDLVMLLLFVSFSGRETEAAWLLAKVTALLLPLFSSP